MNTLPDLELEFLIGGYMVAVANLFDAELAIAGPRNPFSYPVNAIGAAYSLFSTPLAQALDHPERPVAPSAIIHPEGPLFDFSERRPLSQLLDLVGPGKKTAIARSIFDDLARLPENERADRIVQINNVLNLLGALPSDQVIGKGMPSRYARGIVEGLGLLIPFLGNALGGLQLIDEVVAWYRDAERLKHLGDDMARTNRQIELLSRIRKVAWLSEKKKH